MKVEPLKDFMLTFDEDINYQPTDEEMADYWSGEGHIEFYVIQNAKGVFEIEVTDCSGCAGGLGEMLGLEYAIEHELGVDRNELREGYTYTLHKLTVYHTRGDGWEIEPDSRYYFEEMTGTTTPWRYLSQKISNIWWRNIGWRLAQWRIQK